MTPVTLAHFYACTIGLSLLRRWYTDGEVNEVRMAELADVIGQADELPLSLELNPTERDLQRGYSEWSGSYDGPNPLVDAEAPIVRPILERFGGPGIDALDAACGTGRHTEWLAQIGCDTVVSTNRRRCSRSQEPRSPVPGWSRATCTDCRSTTAHSTSS